MLKVNQKIFLKPVMNAARRGEKVREVTITKVGRKYFYVDNCDKMRFFVNNLQQDGRGYSPNWIGYLTLQEIENDVEFDRLCALLRKKFTAFGKIDISLENIRKIAELADCR